MVKRHQFKASDSFVKSQLMVCFITAHSVCLFVCVYFFFDNLCLFLICFILFGPKNQENTNKNFSFIEMKIVILFC